MKAVHRVCILTAISLSCVFLFLYKYPSLNSAWTTSDRSTEDAEGILRMNNLPLDYKIDNMMEIGLPLLADYKNPCWREPLSPNFSQEYRPERCMFPDQANASFSRIIPLLSYRVSEHQHSWRLRCLPLVYIIGVVKCGTSDLFETLTSHPYIVRGATKEPFFWDWGHWQRNGTHSVSDYLNLYDEAAEVIRKLEVRRGKVTYHPAVTIDASVRTLTSFDGSGSLPGNRDRTDPVFLAAHLIRNLTPDTDLKIILLLRNPVQRLFSSYVFFNTVTHPTNISSEEFHDMARTRVMRITDCLQTRTLRSCLYDPEVTEAYKKVDVAAGIYYGYVRDWIRVFPEMRIVRTVDYAADRPAIYRQLVDYIGLPYIRSSRAESSYVEGRGPPKTFQMLPQTRTMLERFYKPFNRKLADLLDDDKFLFDS